MVLGGGKWALRFLIELHLVWSLVTFVVDAVLVWKRLSSQFVVHHVRRWNEGEGRQR